jgi:diaminopimelate epimerase
MSATAEMAFVKAHGLGNDFLLLEAAAVDDPARLARQICARHTGVGADGIVLLGPAEDADASFRIFNADGSEAELSGNAMRCAVAWLAAERGLAPGARLRLATRVGLRTHELLERRGQRFVFRSEIGRPVFEPARIPFAPPAPVPVPAVELPLEVAGRRLTATVLWMGNPQCVLLVDDLAELDWQRLGPAVERHPWFPERINASFGCVVAADRVVARFWERGVGPTQASGTGSCAVAVAAALAGRTGRRVRVETELGELAVHWRDDDVVELVGPAELVARGTFWRPEREAH